MRYAGAGIHPFYKRGNSFYFIMFLPEEHFVGGFFNFLSELDTVNALMTSQVIDDPDYNCQTKLCYGLNLLSIYCYPITPWEVQRYMGVFGHRWHTSNQVFKLSDYEFKASEAKLQELDELITQRERKEEKARIRKEKWGF